MIIQKPICSYGNIVPVYDNGNVNTFSTSFLNSDLSFNIYPSLDKFSHTCLQRVKSYHMEAVLRNQEKSKKWHPLKEMTWSFNKHCNKPNRNSLTKSLQGRRHMASRLLGQLQTETENFTKIKFQELNSVCCPRCCILR